MLEQTTHKIPTHAGFTQHITAVSAAVLKTNITETVCEMTLLHLQIIKVRESFGSFI